MSQHVVTTLERLQEQVDYFLDQDAFAFDCETTGLSRLQPVHNKVIWLSFATHGRAFALPLGHPLGNRILGYEKEPRMGPSGQVRNYTVPLWEPPPPQLRWHDVIPVLEPLLYNTDIVKVGQNLPFDGCSIAKYFGGRIIPPPYRDIKVIQWLVNENLKPRGLKDQTKRWFKIDYDSEGVGKKVENHPFWKVARYAFMDAKMTWLHDRRLEGQLAAEGMERLWELEHDIIGVVMAMHLRGAPVNVATVEALEEKFATRLIDLEGQTYRAAGRHFNIGSAQQKAEILFGPKPQGQGLRPHKLTPGGAPSTDKNALEPHAFNPVVVALSQYSGLDKLQGTYVKAWLGHHDKKDKPPHIINGSLHASFNQSGTDTGRFSSSEPNVQNIPGRTEEGRLVRAAIEAPTGYRFIVADYDQIELRILAHYAGPGRLWDAFLAGEDPHAATAAAVFGKDITQVTSLERAAGKGSNFAVIYGSGATTIAASYGIPLKMAQQFLRDHPKFFPEIYALKDKILSVCKSRHPAHVKTILGRKRRLPEIHYKNRDLASAAERQAVNHVVQGSNADIIKLAMVELERRSRAELPELELILTVHDELVALCPEELVADGIRIVRESMLGPHIQKLLDVELTSEVKVVTKWSDAK